MAKNLTNGCTPDHEKENPDFFADQFENLADFTAHYEGTWPEIWEQTGSGQHAFIAAAGLLPLWLVFPGFTWFLLRNDGPSFGSSSAMNFVEAVRVAKEPFHVTVGRGI